MELLRWDYIVLLVYNIICATKFAILIKKKKVVFFINYRVDISIKVFAIFCASMALLLAIYNRFFMKVEWGNLYF